MALTAFQRFLCSVLAMLPLVQSTAAAVTGFTLGMLTQDGPGTFYLHHVPLNASLAIRPAPEPVTPSSNGSTIMFLNDDDCEALMFSPPQGSSTEWLVTLDNEAGGTVVHYNVSSKLLQIDQVHAGLQVGPWMTGDIQQILWLESQQCFYGISVDQEHVRGELYLDFYADMVDELQQWHPKPRHNLTLSLGANNQYILMKQSMAVSQQHQRMFLMPGVWNPDRQFFYAALWTYDVDSMTVSEPIAYRNNSSPSFTSRLVYSDKRDALYAVVVLGDDTVQVLVDRIDWKTGEVTPITAAVPVSKAGLVSLRAALDDDSGDIYITFMSLTGDGGFVVPVHTVNVDSKEVHTLVELPSSDMMFGIGLTGGSSSSEQQTRHRRQPKRTGPALSTQRVRVPRSKLLQDCSTSALLMQ